uniref:ABC transmembrane type-1 domain-containing protein n=1 Tax=Panagrellus redivivus TaxID=6233 RepID=A0A7E4W4Q0_PANRE
MLRIGVIILVFGIANAAIVRPTNWATYNTTSSQVEPPPIDHGFLKNIMNSDQSTLTQVSDIILHDYTYFVSFRLGNHGVIIAVLIIIPIIACLVVTLLRLCAKSKPKFKIGLMTPISVTYRKFEDNISLISSMY